MITIFKNLKLGVKRLIYVLSFIFPLTVQYIIKPRDFFDLDDKDFWYPLITALLVYWLGVFIVLWIIEGFKNSN